MGHATEAYAPEIELWRREESRSYSRRFCCQHAGGGAPAPHELIGDCGITCQQVEGECFYEIGYHLRRDFWGQVLATEAACACRDWAFTHLKTERLISLIRPENLRSRRVAERTEMIFWKEVNWRGLPHCVYCIERAQSS